MNRILKGARFWILLGMIAMPALALACSTPVFEYALQRWSPDAYRIHISHSAEPYAHEEAAIELLQGHTGDSKPGANIDISMAVATNSPSTITVSYPRTTRINTPVWQAPLTLENANTVVDSPVRQLIFKEIASGQCAVWLFLESGNRDLDDAAERRLRAILQEMEKTLVLPENALKDDDDASAPPKRARKASFAVVRMSRTDPAEAVLVSSLLDSEPDLRGFKEPMVFPVFGRGRMLYAIVGKGINADVVERASVFMTGSCACEVKQLNPGMDLLFSANWDGIEVKFDYEDPPLPPLSGIAVDTIKEAIPVISEDTSPSGTEGRIARNTLFALVCLAGLVFAGSIAIFFKKRGPR